MKNVKKVNGFKTSDGKIFDNEVAANEYQYEFNIKMAMMKFCDIHFWTDMGKEDAAEIMAENAEELRKIFEDNPPVSS